MNKYKLIANWHEDIILIDKKNNEHIILLEYDINGIIYSNLTYLRTKIRRDKTFYISFTTEIPIKKIINMLQSTDKIIVNMIMEIILNNEI